LIGYSGLICSIYQVFKGEKLVESDFEQQGPFGFFIKISNTESFTIEQKKEDTKCILKQSETKEDKQLIITDKYTLFTLN
jgi:hypothetical protein